MRNMSEKPIQIYNIRKRLAFFDRNMDSEILYHIIVSYKTALNLKYWILEFIYCLTEISVQEC